jgi:hypothetical protein
MDCFNKEHEICLRCGRRVTYGLRFLFAGRLWYFHEQCARCTTCHRELTPEIFAAEQDRAVCRSCWLTALTMECRRCHGPVLKHDLVHFRGEWHERCLTCEQCDVSLLYQRPGVVGTSMFCRRCFDCVETHCAICRMLITGEKQKFQGRIFHLTCFTCSICKRPIADRSCEFSAGNLRCRECLIIDQ